MGYKLVSLVITVLYDKIVYNFPIIKIILINVLKKNLENTGCLYS